MHCTCVRYTELPHTSSLFADVLYHPDRTAAFYVYPYRTLDEYRAAAALAAGLSEERRSALIQALRIHNPASAALELLAKPETVAVVTGQQVGLFSGPAYTIYKALHAVRLARWLTENGVPAVPVFWLATEDHDFAEVNHAWVFDADHRPIKLEMHRSASAQPVGGITLPAPPVEDLRAALRGLAFGEEVADLVEAAYTAGSTMGFAFSTLLRRLLKDYDILYADPMLPAFRELAAPALQTAVKLAPELAAALLDRNQQLQKAGYHAQVHVEPHTSLVFLLEQGKRLALRRHGQEYVLNGRRFTSEELEARAVELSPNALLRPVVQDSIFPTVAYIGGPAENAYFAQSEVIYRSILGRMPVAVPRTGFTILDERTQKLMDRYHLSLGDFFHGEQALREKLSAALVPPSLKSAFREALSAATSAVDRLRRELASFDPTLAAALDRSAHKIRYQFEKIERKAGREAMRRDARAARYAAYAYHLIYPEQHLQERLYSFVPFVAKFGFDLVDILYNAIQLDCPDHRLMVL
jgi:bacillithiol biosynthesis cysteine-adding enzyme BshC